MFVWQTAQNPLKTKNSKSIPSKQGILKTNKLEPGDLIFSDQFESRLPGRVFGHRGSHLSLQKYRGGTLFCDAASGFIFAKSQFTLTAIKTIESKVLFKRQALSAGGTNQIILYRKWDLHH